MLCCLLFFAWLYNKLGKLMTAILVTRPDKAVCSCSEIIRGSTLYGLIGCANRPILAKIIASVFSLTLRHWPARPEPIATQWALPQLFEWRMSVIAMAFQLIPSIDNKGHTFVSIWLPITQQQTVKYLCIPLPIYQLLLANRLSSLGHVRQAHVRCVHLVRPGWWATFLRVRDSWLC